MANDATLHIRLENSLKKELEDYAVVYSIKLSNVIRIALEDFVSKDHETTTVQVSKINPNNF
jgi:antitoxin component of RelBE/YafQ-DinJ toxin-antitoxin module